MYVCIYILCIYVYMCICILYRCVAHLSGVLHIVLYVIYIYIPIIYIYIYIYIYTHTHTHTHTYIHTYIGALPICHGSGGLAGQYRFRARTNLSVLVLGALKLVLGLFFAPPLLVTLHYFPTSILAAMLAISAFELASAARSAMTQVYFFLYTCICHSRAHTHLPHLSLSHTYKLHTPHLPQDADKVRLCLLTCCFTLFCGTAVGFLLGLVAASLLGEEEDTCHMRRRIHIRSCCSVALGFLVPFHRPRWQQVFSSTNYYWHCLVHVTATDRFLVPFHRPRWVCGESAHTMAQILKSTLYSVLYSQCTRALTFQNFWQGKIGGHSCCTFVRLTSPEPSVIPMHEMFRVYGASVGFRVPL
jgi:hypothetical protein